MSAPRRKVLLLVSGTVGNRMTAPAIRGWEMARVLSEGNDVTVMAHLERPSVREGIRMIPWSRLRVLLEALRHDVVIGPRIPPYVLAALTGSRTVVVADLYNPVEAELAGDEGRIEVSTFLENARAAKRLQIQSADVLLCAGERQRRRLAEEVERLPWPDGGRPELEVVPFGIPEPPRGNGRPLRERFPQIASDDVVVLWWGSAWKWFDSETAIRAVQRLTAVHPKVKLVFAPGRAPDADRHGQAANDGARGLAESLGLLDETVFFLDKWVPYDERHRYLADADVGLTLHKDAGEAQSAARYRYMDYLWASLPCVLGQGDELAERFAEAGFAIPVPPGDPEKAAAALGALVKSREARERAQAAAVPLAEEYRWPSVVGPLEQAVDRAVGESRCQRRAPQRWIRDLGPYYLRRVSHEVASALRRTT